MIASTSFSRYDLNGNTVFAQDDNGNVTVSAYDLMNRITRTRHRMSNPNADSPADLITSLTYSNVGEVESSTEPNGNAPGAAPGSFTTNMLYDELLRLTKKVLPPVVVPGQGIVRYEERMEYGRNSGSGVFTILSGWNSTRMINRRGFATDASFDAIYRSVQIVRRLDNGNAIASDAPARGGEPATLTTYNKVHKPIKVTVLNENFAGGAENQTAFNFYDDLYRVTVTVIDMNGNGPGVAEGTFINEATTFAGDPSDLITRTLYDLASNPLRVIDPENHTTDNEYDGADRMFRSTANSVANFDPSGFNPNGVHAPVTFITYDKNSNKEIIENPNHTRTRYFFDARNRQTECIVDLNGDGNFDPTFNGPDIVSQSHYDLIGNVIQAVDSRGNASDMDYDRAYRVLRARGPVVRDDENGGALRRPATTTDYDPDGKPVLVTDPRGVRTQTVYDGLNRARTVTIALGTPSAVTTENRYDANANVESLVVHNFVDGQPQDQITIYEYDSLDRQVRHLLPNVGDGISRATITTYYRNGNLRTVTDPKKQQSRNEYDRANRLQTSRFIRADQSVEEVRTLTYNKVGNPLTISDKNGQTAYGYDELYRVSSETRQTLGQQNYTVASSYDLASNRTKTIYPQTNRTLISRYDRQSRPRRIEDGSKVSTYDYDANSNRIRMQMPNGVTDTFSFDTLNRVRIHISSSVSFSSPLPFPTLTLVYFSDYGYDLVGNKRSILELIGGGNPIRNLTYDYDDQYRLTREQWGNGNDFNRYQYTFDLIGNRKTISSRKGNISTVTSYEYDALNQLNTLTNGVEITAYEYDLNGNRSKKNETGPNPKTTEYSYDTLNRLTSASLNSLKVFEASYDYRTRRLTKTEKNKNTYFRYDGGDSFQEIENNALQVEFIRGSGMGGGIGSILYSDRTASGGVVEHFTYNAVGHTVALSNSSGVVTESNLYEAYGNIVSSKGVSKNNRLANTKERDASIGLDNHGMRYYDPEVGRYTKRDPLGEIAGVNIYIYVSNNPINHIDPLGLFMNNGSRKPPPPPPQPKPAPTPPRPNSEVAADFAKSMVHWDDYRNSYVYAKTGGWGSKVVAGGSMIVYTLDIALNFLSFGTKPVAQAAVKSGVQTVAERALINETKQVLSHTAEVEIKTFAEKRLSSEVEGAAKAVEEKIAAKAQEATKAAESEAQVVKNKRAGTAREKQVQEELVAANPEGKVLRERTLLDKEGKKVIDPVTKEGRRLDHVVLDKEGKAIDVVETTSQNAKKTAQIEKEERIREAGGTFIRDKDSDKLVDIKDVPTRIERRD